MREIIRKLCQLKSGQDVVAYCRLVETRGSTPQKAGAMMLVYPDGGQEGTLGGGCVEAEVKRRALAVLAGGSAEVQSFQLDSDYGWDDGLICGGRMQVLIEPLGGELEAYFGCLGDLMEQGCGFTEVIVFDAKSSDLQSPQSYLFDAQENVRAILHAGTGQEVPAGIVSQLRALDQRPRAWAAGGIAFLPVLPRCRLLVVGAGHIGQAVAQLAADLEFDVWVVDDRQEYVNAERFPRAEKLLVGNISDLLPNVEITPSTYCLIVTRGHNHDEQALFHLAERGARYVGMIGSRRKIGMIFEGLRSEGISESALGQVYAPLGIDIGSKTVPEIAVSICAELIAHRNCDGQVPGRTVGLSEAPVDM
ncbi:MAG: hypothetical protein CMJ75_00720 [Planctomycetaceae bacterium]|nr:hypothetical protein [Planctomycetaceae bacterium]